MPVPLGPEPIVPLPGLPVRAGPLARPLDRGVSLAVPPLPIVPEAGGVAAPLGLVPIVPLPGLPVPTAPVDAPPVAPAERSPFVPLLELDPCAERSLIPAELTFSAPRVCESRRGRNSGCPAAAGTGARRTACAGP